MPELTKDFVKFLLEERVREVRFKPMLSGASICKVSAEGEFDLKKYIININSLKESEEQKLGMIHEMRHFLYGIESDTPEEVIESEAKRFYRENQDFVNELYETLKRKSGISS